MSKSKGNVVCPFDMAERYTAEGLRYFLLRESVPHTDGNFSTAALVNVLNNELANTLGNLVCTKALIGSVRVGSSHEEPFPDPNST